MLYEKGAQSQLSCLHYFSCRRKPASVDPMIFACVSMIAKAVGQKMATKDSIFKDIIDQMLGVGLRYTFCYIIIYSRNVVI